MLSIIKLIEEHLLDTHSRSNLDLAHPPVRTGTGIFKAYFGVEVIWNPIGCIWYSVDETTGNLVRRSCIIT